MIEKPRLSLVYTSDREVVKSLWMCLGQGTAGFGKTFQQAYNLWAEAEEENSVRQLNAKISLERGYHDPRFR